MKGRIAEIKHFAVHDGPGIRTTVFLKGCTLRCVWCHNPETVRPESELAFLANKCTLCGNCAKVCSCHKVADGKHVFDRANCRHCGKCVSACYFDALVCYGREAESSDLMEELLADRVFYDCSGGGVTVSGGEPLMQDAFTAELLKSLKEKKIHTAVDTCGNVPWSAFEKVLDYTDIFLYDLKHPDSAGHRRCTGCGNELILENLSRLDAAGKTIEVRMPIIPQWNDSPDDMRRSAEILKKLNHLRGVKLLAYHSFSHSKYAAVGHADTMPDVPSPDEEAMRSLSQILLDQGIRVFR